MANPIYNILFAAQQQRYYPEADLDHPVGGPIRRWDADRKAFIYQDALGNELPFLEDFVIQQRDYYKDYCDVARMSGTKPWVFRDDRSSELTENVSASIDVTDSYGDVDTAVSSALYRGPIPPTYALDSEQTGNLYLVNAER